METPPVADAFVELLEKSGLLSVDQIAAVAERLKLRDQSDLREVAKLLIRDGAITRFQAERLLEGRHRGFFIDHYKVLEILGAGGMACLYLAEDTRNRQQIALKVLADKHKADAGMLARLKLEARAGQKLRHAGIVRTFALGITDDVFGDAHYLVMEYVRGVNLEELINLKGPVPWRQAADFMRQTALGLHHAHASGMVHRDVKPGNLIVDAQGNAKILDFGLALMDSAEDDEFSLAMIFGHNCLGTADYIAPEQTYDSFAVDARADIYSLGCTLYVALTGKLPYPITSTAEKLEGHRSRPAPPLHEIAPDVPGEMVTVIERMMSKRPDDRFATMAEVAEALAPFAERTAVDFDYPKILAWRAKQARHRFGPKRSSVTGMSPSSTAALRGLSSTSTKRLPQASADTDVAQKPRRSGSSVSLASPFEGTSVSSALSQTDLPPVPPPTGPAIVALADGEWHALTGDRLVIGRDPECDVRIPSSSVSGRHCELRFDGSCWRVVDTGSKNGIQVNGVTVTEQVILPGERLTVARQHHFRLDYSLQPSVDTGRLLQYALAGAVAIAVSLTGVYLWRLLFV